MNLGNLISRHATYRPDHVGVVFEDERLNWRQFNEKVNMFSNALVAGGVGKGEKIATVLPNCLELLMLYWAAAKIGAVSVPMSPLLTDKGLANLLNDSDAVMVITAPQYAQNVDAARPVLKNIRDDLFVIVADEAPVGYVTYEQFTAGSSTMQPTDFGVTSDDMFNIIYSSGTTGHPKGIVHSHYVRSMYCMLFAQTFRFCPESVCLHTGAVIFNGAFVTLMPTFFNGARYILQKAFDIDQVVRTIESEKVTHVMMVPAQIIALLNHRETTTKKLASLEMVLSLGAPLLLEHKQQLEKLLPGRFYELYGLTEGFVTILDKLDAQRKQGSVGACTPFFEMRICDEQGNDLPVGEIGEIVGRGPTLMPEYYKRPDLTAQTIRDGWLFSGDMGYVDEEGFLYLVDRKKDMIISGGVNVYPRDIEEIASRHEAVEEVAVFGLPDEKWGETPVVAVLLRQGYDISGEDLRAWINDNVEARFQKVSQVLIKEEFPRSAAGKTLKRVMRDEMIETGS